MIQQNVRSDNERAGDIVFFVDDYKFLMEGLKSLRVELQKFLPLKKDFGLENTDLDIILNRISNMIDHIEPQLLEDRHGPVFEYGVTWGSLRILKAGGMFALRQLKKRRDDLVQKHPNLPRTLLSAIDEKISQAQDRLEMGVLNGLEPADIFYEACGEDITPTAPSFTKPLSIPSRIPKQFDRIPILDNDLRNRVLPLIAPILEGQVTAEELDKAVREMSVILEDRVRVVADLKDQNLEGVKLMAAAFTSQPPKLVFSSDADVQTSAHHLYRGYSGFVRNDVMHRLVKTYTVERVLQLLGFVDYLLSLLTQAKAPPENPK